MTNPSFRSGQGAGNLRNIICRMLVAGVCVSGLVLSSSSLAALATGASSAASVPPRTINDITALLDQYKPDPKKVQELKDQLAAEPPQTEDKLQLARFYWTRARIERETGLADRSVVDFRLALQMWPKQGRERNRIMDELGWAEDTVGNTRDALESFRQLTAVKEGDWQYIGRSHLVWLLVGTGDLTLAREEFRRSETQYSSLRSHNLAPQYWQTSWAADLERARGLILMAEGKTDDALVAFRKGLVALSVRVEQFDELQQSGNTGSRDAFEQARDNVERLLVEVLRRKGKLSEAEIHLRNVLKSVLIRSGKYHPVTGLAARDFANLLVEQGRYRDAAEMASIAIDIFTVAGVPPQSNYVLVGYRSYARSLAMQDRWVDALVQYEKVSEVVRARAKDQSRTNGARGERDWAIALAKTGNAAEAVAMLEPLVRESSERTGARHYQTSELRGFLGMALALADQKERALQEFREAIPILVGGDELADSDEGAPPAHARRLTQILEAYVALLYEIQTTDLGKRAGLDVAAEAFRVADAARGQSVQRALAASAARSATSDPALAELVRKSQDLGNQLPILYGFLLKMLSAPPEQQLPKVTADMRVRIGEIDKERKALNEQISKRFPAYANLVNPKPVALEDARRALRPGEALLSLLVTPERTYVWAVGAKGNVFAASKLGSIEMRHMVTSLRKALDPGDVQLDSLPELDLATAYKLYAELLKPTEEVWRDATTLMLVANGSLAEIPLAILPTEPVALEKKSGLQFASYRDVPWLARKVAVVQLPSVNSLLTLRALPAGNASRSAFLGLGDPQFDRKQVAAAAGVTRGVHLRNLSIPRTEESGKTVDWIAYSQLARLPDTRDEILAIATALKADPQKDVYLGLDASKQKLKSLDLKGRRVIAFATHGLVPGDFPNLTEPALALAAPDDERESGLLTLDEILTLKLDADWVVLSACNTAAGDGAGAEAVSGLGRGFFYAGSRSLLVTHWPVETRSARMLVSGIFERYTNDAKLTRAEALRQSMLNVMGANYNDPATGEPIFSYAHPIFWAPYAIVGDGGAH